MSNLALICADQLTRSLPIFEKIDKEGDIILMCEVKDEATRIKHHKKKIAFLFSAMRHFAAELERDGYRVCYTKLDDENNRHSFFEEVERHINKHQLDTVIVTEPSEYDVLENMRGWSDKLECTVEILDDPRFLCRKEEFAEWAQERKNLRMEFFYREMRKRYKILMDGDAPQGGDWNYDSQNRKPPKDGLKVPEPKHYAPDDITKEVMELVAEHFSEHFGDLEPFYFAVTRRQALEILKDFIENRLPDFGDYQDAMMQDEPWMYHSHISFYLNCGLLDPKECIARAEEAYHDGSAPLNAVEGFIRQILGWREFIRGVYWLKMPEYRDANALNARRSLPDFFWTGETKMNCLRQCITETKKNAYAHHIQRLMVTGNFTLLTGMHPDEVNEWYWIVYADAFEWVELPNVSGMILFADDGVFASKPYAAGGAYINRMSNYCKNCSYSVTKKNGDKACPFNYLYWNFLLEHEDKFRKNPRMAMVYRSKDKMGEEKIEAIKADSRRFLNQMENGECV